MKNTILASLVVYDGSQGLGLPEGFEAFCVAVGIFFAVAAIYFVVGKDVTAGAEARLRVEAD